MSIWICCPDASLCRLTGSNWEKTWGRSKIHWRDLTNLDWECLRFTREDPEDMAGERLRRQNGSFTNRSVGGSAPPVRMSKCPWAGHWTLIAPDGQASTLWVCEWVKESALSIKVEKHYINAAIYHILSLLITIWTWLNSRKWMDRLYLEIKWKWAYLKCPL